MARNKENQKRLQREWYQRNKEAKKAKSKLWAEQHPEKRKEIVAKARNKHREKRNTTNRAWNSLNQHIKTAHEAKRRAAKLQRTPNWLTQAHFDEIEDFYTIAKMFQLYSGQQYHVDHIVPLQGKKVSGLHTPWNLQVLPFKENLSKSNKTAY